MPLSKHKIKHIVYYMLENRSFDNVLGWLYDCNNPPDNLHLISNGRQREPFYGLEENKYYNRFPEDVVKKYPESGGKHYVKKVGEREYDFSTLKPPPPTPNPHIPRPDPHEEFEHVNVQLFYPDWQQPWLASPPSDWEPTMKGFLASYKTVQSFYKFGPEIDWRHALQILDCYTPKQLNILNTLAADYAVSDYWFSSVPTQTSCNRAFSVCGTSVGQVDNHGAFFGITPSRFQTKTIWEVLCEHGCSSIDHWMIYYQDVLPPKDPGNLLHKEDYFSFTRDAFRVPEPEKHIKHIKHFFEAVKAGELPAFSYLEPHWVGLLEVIDLEKDTYTPNSYHPPAELAPGEHFLKKLYDALTKSPAWEHTLLIITFDEHGGTYDHIPPPQATPPGDTSPPPLPGGECGFQFDRYGVRVPTILVSPWIEPHTVFRSEKKKIPYDHTSMIATVLNWERFGISHKNCGLGNRVKKAPTFENVLCRDTPRDTTPSLPEPFFSIPMADETPYSNLQAVSLSRLLYQLASRKLTVKQAEAEAEKILIDVAESTYDVFRKAIHELKSELAKG